MAGSPNTGTRKSGPANARVVTRGATAARGVGIATHAIQEFLIVHAQHIAQACIDKDALTRFVIAVQGFPRQRLKVVKTVQQVAMVTLGGTGNGMQLGVVATLNANRVNHNVVVLFEAARQRNRIATVRKSIRDEKDDLFAIQASIFEDFFGFFERAVRVRSSAGKGDPWDLVVEQQALVVVLNRLRDLVNVAELWMRKIISSTMRTPLFVIHVGEHGCSRQFHSI